ncbi:MAG: hypothetical protein FJ090_05830 [Deltaproteobacteria bacterium]|nr:hypothetical protein [Deltaproteobacteria bacterium]
MSTGRAALVERLAAHAASDIVVGEAVGAAGLCATVGGNQLRTPLSESSAVGIASGLALAGRRPVVEIIDPRGLERAAGVLSDAAGRPSTFSGTLVVLLALPVEADLPRVPAGLRCRVAGVPGDAVALFDAALAVGGVSVLVVTAAALDGRVEGADAGDAPVVRRAGGRATILAEGAGVPLALELAGDAEVVDLRGCRDLATISPHLARTGRVVLVGHGDPAPLRAALGPAFWRLEAQPLAVHACDGASALSRALSETLSA